LDLLRHLTVQVVQQNSASKGQINFQTRLRNFEISDLKEESVMLLEKLMEVDKKQKKEISVMMPKKVKRRRKIDSGAVEDAEEGEGEKGGRSFTIIYFLTIRLRS
jgi:hypothetical protein